MKISVVTISFNQAQFLRQCMESVLNQDHDDIEYIVVDPGSTDGSREIIDSFGEKIIKIFEKDEGPADGLNKGFSKATGDIFYFINSDDYVLPGAFSNAIFEFSRNLKLDVLLGAGIEVSSSGRQVKSYYPSKISPEAYVHGAVTLFQQGLFFKASVFKQVLGFNHLNKTSWDGELLLSFMLKKYYFKRSMAHFAVFRIYPASITGSQRFSSEYKLDELRMYMMVYKNRSKYANLISNWFRFEKLIFDPVYLFYRIFF